jgi:DNA-binding NarL/FixJ family response regulator
LKVSTSKCGSCETDSPADDSDIVRGAWRKIFEESGWSVCAEASNGEEAIAKAQELRPDIVVLDLSMPFDERAHRWAYPN